MTSVTVSWAPPCPSLAEITSYTVNIQNKSTEDCPPPYGSSHGNSGRSRRQSSDMEHNLVSRNTWLALASDFANHHMHGISNMPEGTILKTTSNKSLRSGKPQTSMAELNETVTLKPSDFCPESPTRFCHTFPGLIPSHCYQIMVNISMSFSHTFECIDCV